MCFLLKPMDRSAVNRIVMNFRKRHLMVRERLRWGGSSYARERSSANERRRKVLEFKGGGLFCENVYFC
ncbi:MAG: hypothetical protein ACTS40_00665 [Candidatus Hodgkinia cicadicola]